MSVTDSNYVSYDVKTTNTYKTVQTHKTMYFMGRYFDVTVKQETCWLRGKNPHTGQTRFAWIHETDTLFGKLRRSWRYHKAFSIVGMMYAAPADRPVPAPTQIDFNGKTFYANPF